MNNLPTHGVQSARIAGPVSFEAAGGATRDVPHGPCLIEPIDQQRAEIIWGTSGEYSAVLSLETILGAQRRGSLVFLDEPGGPQGDAII